MVVDVNSMSSPLRLLQRDCEFHRQRAISALDEVEQLHGYITSLEEDKRKDVLSLQSENFHLHETIASLETLNKSLARQNDILRSRRTVADMFDKREASTQTVAQLREHAYVGSGFSSSNSYGTRFSSTPSTASCQTDSGFWVSVESISKPISKPIRVSSELLSPSAKLTKPYLIRRSLPNVTSSTSYPMSPVDFGEPRVPRPLLAPVPRVARVESTSPISFNPVSAQRRQSGRGKSLGSAARKRWIP